MLDVLEIGLALKVIAVDRGDKKEMPINLMFLVLDGETPSEWKPFEQSFGAIVADGKARKWMEKPLPTDNDEDKLLFSPVYSGKSSLKDLSEVEQIAGVIVDATAPDNANKKEETIRIIRRLSAKLHNAGRPICKGLGYFWFLIVTEKEKIDEVENAWVPSIRDAVRSLKRIDIDPLHQTIWSEDTFEYAVKVYLSNAASDACAGGLVS